MTLVPALCVLTVCAAKEHVLRNPEVPSERKRKEQRKKTGHLLLDVSG